MESPNSRTMCSPQKPMSFRLYLGKRRMMVMTCRVQLKTGHLNGSLYKFYTKHYTSTTLSSLYLLFYLKLTIKDVGTPIITSTLKKLSQ